MCRREKWAFSSYTNTKILPSPKPPSLYPVIWAWNTADFPLLLEGISPPGNYTLAVWHCPSVSRKRDLFENSEPLNYCFFSHIKLWFPGSSSHTVLEPYKKQHCNWWKISFRFFFLNSLLLTFPCYLSWVKKTVIEWLHWYSHWEWPVWLVV